MRARLYFLALSLLLVPRVAGQDSLYVRVIDVGQGHSAVVRIPGAHFMVFDAGHPSGEGSTAFDGIRDVIPLGSEIDLLVISHSDSDHLGAVKRITDAHRVKRIVHGGLERVQVDAWKRADAAIKSEQAAGAKVINLKYDELPPGATYRIGNAFVTFLSGFYAPPGDWDIEGGPEDGEFRNAGSIVVRLLYAGRSILFAGDAIGRHLRGPRSQLIATEKYMIENSPAVAVDSDVIIAPHHGGDNGSSTAFIEAVSPEWVVFPAGRGYDHPWDSTAARYLRFGVPITNIFRTDLGDTEGGEEWSHGQEPGGDGPRDDDLEIVVRENGEIQIGYRCQ